MRTNKEIMHDWQLPENAGYGRISNALDDARAEGARQREADMIKIISKWACGKMWESDYQALIKEIKEAKP